MLVVRGSIVRQLFSLSSRHTAKQKQVRGSALVAASRDIKQQINRWDSSRSVESAVTPPGTWYVYPEFHELEKQTVLSNNWVGVGGAHDISEDGQFITGSLADERYIIVRENQDSVHYFHNVCRHKGALLCDKPKGCAKEFVCPYHAWTYSLNGRLTRAKKLRTIQNFKANENELKRLNGTNWFGLLFLNLNQNLREDGFYEMLHGLKTKLNTLGCYEDNLVHVGSKVFQIDCNWKVLVENYIDGGYHIPSCHESLISLIDQESYKTDVYDGYSVQSTTSNDCNSRVGDNAMYIHIYPNTFINRYGNWVDINYVMPTGPETCKVTFEWYMDRDVYEKMPEEVRENMTRENLEESSRIQIEDTDICENVQKGMRSRSFTHGRYAPLIEHAVHDFHLRLVKDFEFAYQH